MFLLKYMGYSGFTSCEASEMEIKGVYILWEDTLSQNI